MLSFKKTVCILLAVVALGAVIAPTAATLADNNNLLASNDYGRIEVMGDVYSEPASPIADYESGNSFFEDNPFDEEREEWDSVNPYFDELPPTQNSSNFHSLATATFENINGATVTVDTLYRHYKESLNDPNYACGMLMYQAILYKIAHPEEDVTIAFSSFHTSPTAALCVNPNSPYFGYMRALYDRDYDSNGFVRVLYLLVEAAKMGIEVNVIGHRDSYAVKQYNPTTGKLYSKGEPSYVKYLNGCMNYDCYSKYEDGKKVSDFLTLKKINWDYDVKKAMDVMHVKTCAVSAYRDRNGVDHKYGVWFSSTNLDTNNYLGHNGHGGSQSGLIITGHKDIFKASDNYVRLMMEHSELDTVYDFRNIVRTRNEEQIAAALAGEYESIPEDERIVYLGSETDDVFELYFAPFGGEYDTWDTQNNPYCKWLQEFYDSDDEDVVFSWNAPNFREEFYVGHLAVDVIRHKFITNKRIGNRLGLRLQNGILEGFSSLKAGVDLEFVNCLTKWDAVHEKDILMSYVKDGERKYVTFHSSCNFNDGALYFQTNHILVVKEDESTGNVVYSSLGNAMTKGAIKDNPEGMTFSSEERQSMAQKLGATPVTLETEIKLDKAEGVDSYGVLLGNNDFWNPSIVYEINKNGNPQIVLGRLVEKNGLKHFKEDKYVFNKVNVATGERLHLSFVLDVSKKSVSVYIDGELAQKLENISYTDVDRISANTFVVGGDNLGSNYNYFRGTMYSLSVYSDIRTKEEIAADVKTRPDLTDTSLMARYEFYKRLRNEFGGDTSVYGNDLHPIKLWLDSVEEVPEDYYCFAVVPDTQVYSYYYPESITNIYEWLVANKDEKNIEYVIGVGDITELSTKEEYDFAKNEIYKLDGVLPFSLVMGNHDKYDYQKQGYMPSDPADFLFNKTFYNDQYLDELDGWYGEGDVSCSYNAFEIGETKWLLLNLDFGPTDEMLEWASGVIESYPEHNVVIATHAYLYRNGTTLDENECYPASGHNSAFNDGDEIYDKLVRKYENIKLVLCGHDPWDSIVYRQDIGDNGNTVTQLLIDPQYIDKYHGATEMIALLYFSPNGKTMTVRYYSIAKDMYGSELSQFTLDLE